MKVNLLALLLTSILLSQNLQAENYPDKWWEPVDREGAPSWEILPQDADRSKGDVIVSKRTSLGILSNFAATPFVYERRSYKSLEGFWQMMKFPENRYDPRATNSEVDWQGLKRSEVAQLVGFEAKRAGSVGSANMKLMDINWVSYRGERLKYRVKYKGGHYQVIRAAMIEKLRQNTDVGRILLQTGNLTLKPDHSQGRTPPPAWQYHQIWMELRSKLQNGVKF